MNLIKRKLLSIFLSLLCAIAVFMMNDLFQEMAYWGNNLTWYWVGVSCTYIVWLIGVSFLVRAFTKRTGRHTLLTLSLSIVTSSLLVLGFLWTTFVIIAGLSGM